MKANAIHQMHIVPLASVAPQPWRNGGGTTRELLAWPRASGWALRISVAQVAQSGPFSAYAGVSRWFVVLSGAGVELAWPGRQQQLTTESPPVQFDGADPPQCRLLGGATEDLNLMLQQGSLQSHVQGRLTPVQPGQPRPAGAQWQGLYTASACTLQAGTLHAGTSHAGTLHAGSTWALPAHSLAWCDCGAQSSEQTLWQIEGEATLRAWWIDVQIEAHTQQGQP